MTPPTQSPKLASVREAASTRKTKVNSDASSWAELDRRPAFTEAERILESYQIPSLHVAPISKPSPRKSLGHIRPLLRHGKSMSHPFPSLFRNREKRQASTASGPVELADDNARSSDLQTAPPKNLARLPDNALLAGKCMTCNSAVRWPRELSMFRCSVCMTINDLKPAAALPLRGGDSSNEQSSVSPSTNYGTSPSSGVEPLSAARIRVLAEQCITAYLLARLVREENGIGVEKATLLMTRRQENTSTGFASKLESLSLSRNVRPDCSTRESMEIAEMAPAGSPHYVEADGKFNFERMGNANCEARKLCKAEHGGPQNIFKSLEEHIITSFMSRECVNSSFILSRMAIEQRAVNEGTRLTSSVSSDGMPQQSLVRTPTETDSKSLFTGEFEENAPWWAGLRSVRRNLDQSYFHVKHTSMGTSSPSLGLINPGSSRIDWEELTEWYHGIIHAGCGWTRHLSELVVCSEYNSLRGQLSADDMEEMDYEIRKAQAHTQRVLLKATERILKRPAGPLKTPHDIRFLLIILANPILYPSHSSAKENLKESQSGTGDYHDQRGRKTIDRTPLHESTTSSTCSIDQANGPGKHSGIIKRILGLLSNLPNNCHHYLVAWFSKYPEHEFRRTTELVGSFVTYRLSRQDEKWHGQNWDSTAAHVPIWAVPGWRGSTELQTVLSGSVQHSKQPDRKARRVLYDDDWQIKAAARVMALLFSANNSTLDHGGLAIDNKAHRRRQILPNSSFYNTRLDYSDLIADFEAWEARRSKFVFCQYPFFLSIWAKIQIAEYDARRQMEVKAKEAFFDSIMKRKAINQYLILRVRRECLVEDSLKGVSEVVGSSGEEIKKGLRIEFRGEEGIDAGGLRKEWFLLLVRDVFNPEHGLFIYDDDSHFCYFNPNTFENSDQFFLVGAVLGLAIYNSTILDIALPSFAFRKLLATGPSATLGTSSHANPAMTYSLDDLAELRPSLASGLQQLLEFDGDVEVTFCRDFVADIEFYGQNIQIPICPNGEKKPVTNSNRREFVDLYVRYLLDTAVSRQFEPFKRGFFTVCGGNALSLFRPEEIELLIRGSDDPLDISSLRAVAVYENWTSQTPADTEPVIAWFWESFRQANSTNQRKLLSFITGSDRIPAMGAANLVIKLCCLGEDTSRFPVARTCFNVLSLWRYGSQSKLDTLLWRAVHESEGFGLK